MFSCIHPYSADSLYSSPLYSRGALKTLHSTVFPPSCRRTQHVGSLASMRSGLTRHTSTVPNPVWVQVRWWCGRSGLTHTLETVLSQALARDVLHTFYEPSRNLLGAF